MNTRGLGFGIEEVFGNVAMDQYIRITEGNGINITQQPVFQKNILSVMPNPFRDTVQISFELPAHAAVQLVVQNSAGQTVYRSVPKSLAQGAHHLEWAAGENNAGIYQIQLEVNGAAYTKAILKI